MCKLQLFFCTFSMFFPGDLNLLLCTDSIRSPVQYQSREFILYSDARSPVHQHGRCLTQYSNRIPPIFRHNRRFETFCGSQRIQDIDWRIKRRLQRRLSELFRGKGCLQSASEGILGKSDISKTVILTGRGRGTSF